MWWVYPGIFSSGDLLKALGYCYGTFLLMVLLSYSLYYLPIGLYQDSHLASRLQRHKAALKKAELELNDSTYSLEEVCALTADLQRHGAIDLQPYLSAVLALLPREALASVSSTFGSIIVDSGMCPVRDSEQAVALHSQARRASLRHRRARQSVSSLQASLDHLQGLASSSDSWLELQMRGQRGLALLCGGMSLLVIAS
jgi:hypothetical protein